MHLDGLLCRFVCGEKTSMACSIKENIREDSGVHKIIQYRIFLCTHLSL